MNFFVTWQPLCYFTTSPSLSKSLGTFCIFSLGSKLQVMFGIIHAHWVGDAQSFLWLYMPTELEAVNHFCGCTCPLSWRRLIIFGAVRAHWVLGAQSFLGLYVLTELETLNHFWGCTCSLSWRHSIFLGAVRAHWVQSFLGAVHAHWAGDTQSFLGLYVFTEFNHFWGCTCPVSWRHSIISGAVQAGFYLWSLTFRTSTLDCVVAWFVEFLYFL
jgi:hypothetical protein